MVKILKKFNMFGCRPVTLSFSSHFKLSSEFCLKTDEFAKMTKNPYVNVTRSVVYLIVCTRFDLAHSVSILSRFMSNSGDEH